MPALAEAKEDGLVRAVGVGSKSVAALAAAVRTGLCDLIMVAGRLTLLDHGGAELLDLCRAHDVGIVNVGVVNITVGASAVGQLIRSLSGMDHPIEPALWPALAEELDRRAPAGTSGSARAGIG